MNKREKFERFLDDLIVSYKENQEIVLQIQSSLKRLKENPDIFCGNPEGNFFYEDPILANALFYYLESKKIRIVTASGRKKPISNRRIMDYVIAGVKAILNYGHSSYKKLFNKKPKESVISKKNVLHLAVIGDAGFSEGNIQGKVLSKIKARHKEEPFDYLIHLGDIYPAGGNSGVLEHFLAPFMDVGPKVYALLGNHELYTGGESFSHVIDVLQQPGRYFSIENDNWCIACLDTSLPARSIRRIEGELDEEQLKWLKNLINNSSGKGIILMSHHYTVSGWENISPKLKTQIDPLISNIFSWYWGHEHGCATYDKKTVGFYGACVGNGAYLERWKQPKYKTIPDWYPKGRCSCVNKKSHYWQHGYLELRITPDKVYEDYHLENETNSRVLI